MTISVRFQWRRDTAANWTAANPILLAGEPGLETDTGKRKVGDGATSWSGLAYDAGVASVDASGGATGLSFAGGPITGTGTLTLGGTLAVANGGTGAGTAAAARTSLGLGSIATLNTGASGSFTTVDGKTVTVASGVITSIV